MALIDLVEYFNNRFEREHKANYRPLIIENNRVSGLFGQLHQLCLCKRVVPELTEGLTGLLIGDKGYIRPYLREKLLTLKKFERYFIVHRHPKIFKNRRDIILHAGFTF